MEDGASLALLGSPSSDFITKHLPSKTNLKLHTSFVTLKMVKVIYAFVYC